MILAVAKTFHRSSFDLPFCPNSESLLEEFAPLSDKDWQRFPQGLPLIAVGGQLNAEFPVGSYLKPTEILSRCPTVSDLLHQLGILLGRTALVRLSPGQAYFHPGSANYHYSVHRSLLVPLIVADIGEIQVEGESLHFVPGMGYLLEPLQPYSVHNLGSHCIIFLGIETPIEADLPPWLNHAESSSFVPQLQDSLAIVPYRFRVLSPVELADLLQPLKAELQSAIPPNNRDSYEHLLAQIESFSSQWIAAFENFGYSPLGELSYRDLLLFFKEQIIAKSMPWLKPNGVGQRSLKIIGSVLLTSEDTGLRQFSHRLMAKRQEPKTINAETLTNGDIPQFERPIFIVSAPRAGSTLLFETLCRFKEFWSIGKESHDLIEGIPELHPAHGNYHSNRLTETIATEEVSETLKKRFVTQLRNHQGLFYLHLESDHRPDPIRLLEKTPKNALRIPFLKAIFPDARFIFLYRNPAENISSMLEGWRLRRFVSYRGLPRWPYKEWSFLLIPQWEDLKYCSLAEIVAHQWTVANTWMLQDLQSLPRHEWQFLDYADLVHQPQSVMRNLTKFAGLMPDEAIERSLTKGLPQSCMTLSASSPDKWRKYEDEINPVLPITQTICSLVEELRWSQF